MAAGRLNPRDAKLGLAREIVSVLHSPDTARQTEAEFIRVFCSQRKTPTEMPSFVLRQPMTIVELLADAGLARSISEARWLVQQGGVRLDGQWLCYIHARVALPKGDELILRVGRRRFLRLITPDDEESKTNDGDTRATD